MLQECEQKSVREAVFLYNLHSIKTRYFSRNISITCSIPAPCFDKMKIVYKTVLKNEWKLKFSKFWNVFLVSSILPKNERKQLNLKYHSMIVGKLKFFVRFLGEFGEPLVGNEIYLPLVGMHSPRMVALLPHDALIPNHSHQEKWSIQTLNWSSPAST